MINANDIQLLLYLYRFTFLFTGQLAALVGRSSPVVRRAIRTRLIKRGLVTEIKRPHARSQAIYKLSNKGLQYIADYTGEDFKDLPVSTRCPSPTSPHWTHWAEVNELRIRFFQALRCDDFVDQYRDISEFEVNRPRSKSSVNRFELWEDLDMDGRMVRFQPDNLQLLSTEVGGREYTNAFFVELDRGTEDLSRTIQLKFRMYGVYERQNFHRKRFQVFNMRVLIVLGSGLKTRRRLHNMQRELKRLCALLGDENPNRPSRENPEQTPASFAWNFRFAFLDDLSPENILYEPVWLDFQNNPVPLYRLPNSFSPKNGLLEGGSTSLLRGVITERSGAGGESGVISGT